MQDRKQYRKLWRTKNKERINKYAREWYKNSSLSSKQTKAKQAFIRNQILRYAVLSHYCKGIPYCQCPSGKCPESRNPHFEFLEIDHIGGGGNKHRKYISGGKHAAGSKTYKWLIKHNYPSGFRVLCADCNRSIGAYGYCPHGGGGFFATL